MTKALGRAVSVCFIYAAALLGIVGILLIFAGYLNVIVYCEVLADARGGNCQSAGPVALIPLSGLCLGLMVLILCWADRLQAHLFPPSHHVKMPADHFDVGAPVRRQYP